MPRPLLLLILSYLPVRTRVVRTSSLDEFEREQKESTGTRQVLDRWEVLNDEARPVASCV